MAPTLSHFLFFFLPSFLRSFFLPSLLPSFLLSSFFFLRSSFCLSIFLSFCLSVFLSFCLSFFVVFFLSLSLSLSLSLALSDSHTSWAEWEKCESLSHHAKLVQVALHSLNQNQNDNTSLYCSHAILVVLLCQNESVSLQSMVHLPAWSHTASHFKAERVVCAQPFWKLLQHLEMGSLHST